MTRPAPIRLGIAGCGRLAEAGYVPALAGLPGLEVVAVADPDPARRQAVGPDVPGFAGAGELLDEVPALDGLVIASPVAHHVDDAVAAAAAGVVALVEKPPAPDAAGAARLVGLDPAPVIGFNRRFDVAALAARSSVDPTSPVELDLVLRYRRSGWSPVSVGTGVDDDALLDLGPHLVDWVRWISGREVAGVEHAELSPTRAVVQVTLDGAGGRARLEACADRPHTESIEVRQGGALVSAHRTGGAVDGLRARLLRRGRPDVLVSTLRGELAAYAALLRTGERGQLATPADGVAAMTAIDAARAAAREPA